MKRSFGLVDAKVAEANFFLEKLDSAGSNFFKARCYFSAFISSARSITFALQSVMSDVQGFDDWYKKQREVLHSDPVARFFHEARTIDQHVGENPVMSVEHTIGTDRTLRIKYYFSELDRKSITKDLDVVTACKRYLTHLIELVFCCYESFGTVIDPRKYYTEKNFSSLGLKIDDAEEEVFGIIGWTDAPGVSIDDRWNLIRESVADCNIDHLFKKYLGKTRSIIS